ncbi:tyrosine-type recombinase/integrase [Mesonia maritima]|uniref:Tyrosine recombinase XerC n=1 Tax=Mesonia maritima TaxID=1793873 RepID=A0ABU1K6E7_9FLAO|nr:tyrosine-type recombinase/integrase [Mesonia maritima]MDR6301181.1 integrase/recombinase XerC [Mesonia maritima]
MPFSQFIEYLRFEKKYSEHTILAYQKDLENFAKFVQANFEVQDLTTVNYSIIRSWVIHLSEKGINSRSINRKISSLKAYYKFLLRTHQIEQTPLAKHKALKTEKKIQVPFSQKELEEGLALLNEDNFEALRDKLIIELLYTTGMRRAELINIKLQNISIAQETVKILGKRNKERILPLLPFVIETLKKYIKKRNELNKIEDETFLLITSKGSKIYETLVYRTITNYFSKVSTKTKRSPHIIRHTFATHLLDEGANLNDVKVLLGHASLASTQVYTHNSMAALSKVYKNSHPRNKN